MGVRGEAYVQMVTQLLLSHSYVVIHTCRSVACLCKRKHEQPGKIKDKAMGTDDSAPWTALACILGEIV